MHKMPQRKAERRRQAALDAASDSDDDDMLTQVGRKRKQQNGRGGRRKTTTFVMKPAGSSAAPQIAGSRGASVAQLSAHLARLYTQLPAAVTNGQPAGSSSRPAGDMPAGGAITAPVWRALHITPCAAVQSSVALAEHRRKSKDNGMRVLAVSDAAGTETARRAPPADAAAFSSLWDAVPHECKLLVYSHLSQRDMARAACANRGFAEDACSLRASVKTTELPPGKCLSAFSCQM